MTMNYDRLNRNTPKDETDRNDPNNRNPFMFKPAEWFWRDVRDGPTTRPSRLYLDPNDQSGDTCSHGRIFRLPVDGSNQPGFLLIQFMRPKVWRIRFHSINRSAADFTDFNTQTIVQDTLSKMIKILDIAEQVNWRVDFHEVGDKYYVLQSVITNQDKTNEIGVQLWIHRDPFKITAVRLVATTAAAAHIPIFEPPSYANISDKLKITEYPGTRVAIVWQTKESPLEWHQNATVLNIEKPVTSKFTGFGEQGGKRLFKDDTVMNFFNFDNMRYYNVYGDGPMDGPLQDAEPLYHSEPYWIEMNAHPGAYSQIGTFIDNYSQVCIDLGRVNPTLLRIATRFNSFQCIFMAGDDVGQIIRSYTSIIGRPRLKPRYVLGAHQGCYGYEQQWQVEEAVNKYRQYDIPLDGMHIDVDMQRGYRTFTIDTSQGHFPEPEKMFKTLRDTGVKCSTNITPVVSCTPDSEYDTLNQGLKEHYFVLDKRDVDPGVQDPAKIRYLNFGRGNRWHLDPNDKDPAKNFRPGYGDDYTFTDQFNTGKPFRGGVDYGPPKGAAGHYPNLNNKAVREWWGTQYEYLFKTGLEFVWQDMTSPCMSRSYGDMQSWPFRLLLDNDGWSGDPEAVKQKMSIEIWSLYSFNLHKATFKGLDSLSTRKGKRNFIIGRGSFAGAQRYAGLWTGDNVSTWEFLDISVAQVLALGLAGVTIAGADVGGFEPDERAVSFADPELLIRWYSAYSLLPWLRNHYVRKGKKLFQEPYGYYEFQQSNSELWQQIPEGDRNMYYSVLPACRYILKLRYSLIQLMYDAMFENMITGLPIARAMVITDPQDDSLYQQNQWYTRSQYLVRNDLLVAPSLYRERARKTRKVYLPYPDNWYPMNLRPDNGYGVALLPEATGGSYIEYDCRIGPNEDRLPYITPMYIREGAIVPQIEARAYVPDRTRPDERQPANPITINIYPGKDNVYDMYLDDGVSRESAPTNIYLSTMSEADADGHPGSALADAYGDEEAKNVFRHVQIKQTTVRTFAADQLRDIRTVAITTPFSGYDDDKVIRDIGSEYRVVFWHASRVPGLELDLGKVNVNIKGTDKGRVEQAQSLRATVVHVPVDALVSSTIEVSCPSRP